MSESMSDDENGLLRLDTQYSVLSTQGRDAIHVGFRLALGGKRGT